MHLSPAEYVIHIFGGVRATARVLGKHPATVSKWQNRREKESNYGLIPVSSQKLILDKAKELNLDITPFDLIYGRSLKRP